MKRENLEKITKHYYLGLTSAVEEKALFDEIRSDSESRHFFNEYEKEFAKSHLQSPSLEKEWQKFRLRYLDKSQIRKRSIIRNISRYAAVIGLAVLLAGGYSFFNSWNSSNEPIAWYETYVPRGEKGQITLPDGTKVWLNAETTLKYPAEKYLEKKGFAVVGEGFFEVAKNEDVPFVVRTNNYDVVVKGTSFNVMAYEDFDRTETSLLSGQVEIRNIKGKTSGKSVNLSPGQKLVFNKKEETVCVVDAEVSHDAAWKDNLFIFKDVRFEILCRRLERWYDVSVTLADPELKEIRYTGNFRNEETIWQVLDIIKITTPIKYELKKQEVNNL